MRPPTLNNLVEYVFVHCTAVSRSINPDQWHQTNEYHRKKWNFRSSLGNYAGYTYEIAADGSVRQSRQEGEETAAVIGFNRDSISVALDGDFDHELPTLEQSLALRELLIEIQKRHDVPFTNILPHRSQLGKPPSKTCYGSLLPDDWAQRLVIDPDSIDIKVDPYNPPLGSAEINIDRECC